MQNVKNLECERFVCTFSVYFFIFFILSLYLYAYVGNTNANENVQSVLANMVFSLLDFDISSDSCIHGVMDIC